MEPIKKIRLLESLLLEKDFFDTDDSDTADKQDNKQTSGDDLNLDLDDATTNEAADIDHQEVLKLKILWANLLYFYRLTRKLYVINDRFEPVYEKFEDLFRVFRDFIINYEYFQPKERQQFITNFRKAFIETIKDLKVTIQRIGG
jgi:hypothetical protein